MIANDMLCDLNKVNDVCVYITTVDADYDMSFIEYEKEDVLGVKYTVEDGTERFIILNKAHVTSVGIVYQQDLDNIFEDIEDENFSDVMYQ